MRKALKEDIKDWQRCTKESVDLLFCKLESTINAMNTDDANMLMEALAQIKRAATLTIICLEQ